MRVLVTGASRHLGSAGIPELLSAGHQVVALAAATGGPSPCRLPEPRCTAASLEDLEGLREAAAASDGVIHLAFKYDVPQAGDVITGAGDADLHATRRSVAP